ncbi:aa3-type cytochrome c oxidase subunit IV [Phenylobacterium sp. J367]|uniref:aa3-type cytochrome c oxidase subunit IV n=1 Tax=Phenylobacterium sp. J367 TaxID=2898435 RepID=UPI0021512B3B|nr:aa3-type cytochrome c oxidase subunit IV [Phenylobacterium sp. J367]MCR5878476.1 aa3-type cytochrome c oxidase subunit IV [Phenylobacterium sp. J367]
MADPDYHRGEMDISEQTATYALVMGMTKWGSLATAALILWLTLWFCTETGFLGATVAAVALTVIGVVALREKSAAAH